MKDDNFLKANNARSLWHPMTAPSDSHKNPPVIVTKASGVRIRDIDGHETVDAVGGLWNVNLGYSAQTVKDAIAAQLDQLPYYSTFRGTSNDQVIELAEELRLFFEPDGLTRAFFTSGGSDSVETALRLARQYHKIRGDGTRTKFLSLKKGYHGTHMGGASVNGNANFRTQYEPLLPGCFHIPAPYTYRNPFNESDPARLAHLADKKARHLASIDQWKKRNPEKVKAYQSKCSRPKNRYSSEVKRLAQNSRVRIKQALKSKKGSSILHIGCGWDCLKKHLENQFQEGMTWENYGLFGWHVDHRVPLASASTIEDLLPLLHFKNLQPLWARDNLSKGHRF
jgi:hypothetical protein